MVFKKGQSPWNKGRNGYKVKPRCEQSKQLMRDKFKNREVTWGENISKGKTGKDNGHAENCGCPFCTGPTSEMIENARQAHLGKPGPNKGKHPSLESIEKGRQKKLGKKRSEESKQKQSKTLKSMYDNDITFRVNQKKGIQFKYDNDQDYRIRHAKSVLIGLKMRPTSLEQEMIFIIEKHNLPFKYVGDGQFLIGHKNPDFIHINKKICIEVANTFHHHQDYPEVRANYFKKYGWKCIVFYGDYLNEQEVLKALTS